MITEDTKAIFERNKEYTYTTQKKSFICSRCCREIHDEPKKVWNENGHRYEFCEYCSDRIDRDPDCQFTCTDWYQANSSQKTNK